MNKRVLLTVDFAALIFLLLLFGLKDSSRWLNLQSVHAQDIP